MQARNPLHASALRVCDLTPGRRILLCSLKWGVTELVVMSRPRGRDRGRWRLPDLIVKLRSAATGDIIHRRLADIGVTPHKGNHWSRLHFVVDHRKRHLLPETITKPQSRTKYLES